MIGNGNLEQHTNEGGWEQWHLEPTGLSDGTFFITNTTLNKRLCASDDKKTVTTTTNKGGWERFKLITLGGDKYCFETHCGQHLSQTDSGKVEQSPNKAGWEQFSFKHVGGTSTSHAKTETKTEVKHEVKTLMAHGQRVSLESCNFPGHYIRHKDARCSIGKFEESKLFRADASWVIRPGLADPHLFSFESVNVPGEYIRHRDSELWKDKFADNALFKKDATFQNGTARSAPSDTHCSTLIPSNFTDHCVRHKDFKLYINKPDPSNPTLFSADATFRMVPALG
jgi:hypothetical protein